MIPDALRSGVLSAGQPCGIPMASAVCPGNVTDVSTIYPQTSLMSYSLQGRDSDFGGAERKYVLFRE